VERFELDILLPKQRATRLPYTRGCRILRLRPWHGSTPKDGKFPVKSDLPALLISGIKCAFVSLLHARYDLELRSTDPSRPTCRKG